MFNTQEYEDKLKALHETLRTDQGPWRETVSVRWGYFIAQRLTSSVSLTADHAALEQASRNPSRIRAYYGGEFERLARKLNEAADFVLGRATTADQHIELREAVMRLAAEAKVQR